MFDSITYTEEKDHIKYWYGNNLICEINHKNQNVTWFIGLGHAPLKYTFKHDINKVEPRSIFLSAASLLERNINVQIEHSKYLLQQLQMYKLK
jgi:hypothetical protein